MEHLNQNFVIWWNFQLSIGYHSSISPPRAFFSPASTTCHDTSISTSYSVHHHFLQASKSHHGNMIVIFSGILTRGLILLYLMSAPKSINSPLSKFIFHLPLVQHPQNTVPKAPCSCWHMLMILGSFTIKSHLPSSGQVLPQLGYTILAL